MPKPSDFTFNALAHLLPSAMVDRLLAHCALTGDDVANVLADAVELHFDELAGAVDHDFSIEAFAPAPGPQAAAQAAVTDAMAVAP